MPLPLHLELIGKKQGKINGSCDMQGREDSILIQAIHHSIVLPYNEIDGKPTGKKNMRIFQL